MLGAALSSLVIFAAPVMASAHEMHHQDLPNIVETAVSVNKSTGEFSTLIAALTCTNLVNKLSNEDRSFTVFAPTDAAFAKLNLSADNVCASFSKHDLKNILKYHVSRGAKDAAEVLSRDHLTMLNWEDAEIVGATIAGQNIIQTDIMTSNGIIHIIDGVMIPPADQE